MQACRTKRMNEHGFESEVKVLVQSAVPVSIGFNWFSVVHCWTIVSGKSEADDWVILKDKNKCFPPVGLLPPSRCGDHCSRDSFMAKMVGQKHGFLFILIFH